MTATKSGRGGRGRQATSAAASAVRRPRRTATGKDSPRERRRRSTHRSILEATRRLVAEHGPRKLSLRQVARACDYSPAALYEYFASKDDLLAALVAEGFRRLHGALDSVAAAPSARARLALLGLRYIDFAREHPEYFQLIFTLHESSLKSLEAVHGENTHYGLLHRAMLDYLAEHTGNAGDDDRAEGATYGFWSLVHGLAMLQSTFLRGFDADFGAGDRWCIDRYLAGVVATTDVLS